MRLALGAPSCSDDLALSIHGWHKVCLCEIWQDMTKNALKRALVREYYLRVQNNGQTLPQSAAVFYCGISMMNSEQNQVNRTPMKKPVIWIPNVRQQLDIRMAYANRYLGRITVPYMHTNCAHVYKLESCGGCMKVLYYFQFLVLVHVVFSAFVMKWHGRS